MGSNQFDGNYTLISIALTSNSAYLKNYCKDDSLSIEVLMPHAPWMIFTAFEPLDLGNEAFLSSYASKMTDMH